MKSYAFSQPFLLVLCLVGASIAQNSSKPLIGCGEVGCPGAYECPLAGDDLQGIGLTNASYSDETLSQLAFIKGASADPQGIPSDYKTENRTFKSLFYIGTPSDFDFDSISGCVIFFHDTYTLEFPSANGSGGYETDQGACSDVIAQECIDTLQERARKANGTSESEVCANLEADLRKNTIAQCKDFSGKSKGLGRFGTSLLSNASAITGSKNESSKCWPLEDRADKLFTIGEDSVKGDFNASTIIDEIWKITPMLTVFLPIKGQKTLVNKTTSTLNCLKLVREVVTPDGPALPGENDSSGVFISASFVLAISLYIIVAGILYL